MFKPKKSLGQNFLQDKNIIKKILNLTNIKNANILEVGPGYGILTDEIIKLKPKCLILIEKDKHLYNLLIKKYKKLDIKIINEDILNFNFKKLSNFKIISNLPYNISSKFLISALKYNIYINEIICMIQSELADKFDASKNKMNKYKFISKYCSEYKIKFNVSNMVFYPKPKVKSKVVSFLLKKQKINYEKFDYFNKYFFIHKRKKIKSNKKFTNCINDKFLDLRYEDLEFDDILKIYQRFKFSVT